MATVPNLGMPGSPVDLSIGSKTATNAFRFNGQPTTKVAVTTTTQPVQLMRVFNGDNVVRVINTGNSIVRLKFGRDSTVIAQTTDKGILPGATELFTVGVNVGWVAVIGDAAGSIEFDCGSGV